MWLGGLTMKIALIDDEPAELARLSEIIKKTMAGNLWDIMHY